MADKTKIDWCDATINPVVGCSHASPGCDHCYAERMAARLESMGTRGYSDVIDVNMNGSRARWNGKTAFVESELDKPSEWKKPRRIFVCSMGDLFHESVPFAWITRVLETVVVCPQHTFILLTKRAEKMETYFRCVSRNVRNEGIFPIPNLWIGVTAENQEQADARIPLLLRIPAAKRFVSIEPMLGPILLDREYFTTHPDNKTGRYPFPMLSPEHRTKWTTLLDWVILGGESGPGARPLHPDWVRRVRDDCALYGVPFFFKAWGSDYTFGALAAGYQRQTLKGGYILDGRLHRDIPGMEAHG